MTMQVGMVGTDGVLIASDTKWHVNPAIAPDKFWAGGRYSFNSTKIKIDYERRLAVSQALNMEVAGRISAEIISTLPTECFSNPEAEIKKIGERVLESAALDRREMHCILALCDPRPALFLVTFALFEGARTTVCRGMERFVFGGDNVNPAICWAEQYYQKRSIKELIPLASHLIVSAGRLNSGSISGLEIVCCDNSGPHRFSQQSLDELSSKADEWDKTIADLFLNHHQEFSYAPNVTG